MTEKPVIYRYTGAAPGSAAVITSLSLGSWDSNASLALYPVKKGTSTAYSYIAVLALGFSSDPGTVSSFRLWPTLTGSLDSNVTIKIATTLADTYIPATGTVSDSGNSINSVYSLATEDIFNYSSGSPKFITGTDLVATTGTGRYTKFIPVQIEIGASANVGAVPVDPSEITLNCSALES